jgi:site-specific DNA recombinase
MAEWERAEIAERIAASVPIRAKLGKPLGGRAPFGYKWVNKEFVINELEAPIRKLVYELFLQHRRKKTTANALNKLGYRTRKGVLFTDSTIIQLLRDPCAKGERRAAFTKSLGKGKAYITRPESEWILTPCPAIVSEELWHQCNAILDEQERSVKKPGPKAVHLLSGFVKCTCGKTMYVFHASMLYKCKHCKRRIAVSDIDEIFQHHLKAYLSSINTAEYLEESDQQLQEKKQLLETATRERAKLAKQITTLVQLSMDGELSKERFKEQYDPLEAQVAQLDRQLPALEAEIDVRTIQLLSTETVFEETRTLYEQWPTMPFEQKRAIVEIITTAIEVGTDDITITLAYAPPSFRNDGKGQYNHDDAEGPRRP